MPGKLTDTRLRDLKGNGKVQKISNGQGLYIHVTPTGSRLWRMACSFAGKQKTISFGQYPAVGLGDARMLCLEAKELLVKGLDPGTEKKRIKAEIKMPLKLRRILSMRLRWNGWTLKKIVGPCPITKRKNGLSIFCQPILVKNR